MEEAKEMNLKTAKTKLGNAIYESCMFETFENAGKIGRNGHHMAQEVVENAEYMLEKVWIGE